MNKPGMLNKLQIPFLFLGGLSEVYSFIYSSSCMKWGNTLIITSHAAMPSCSQCTRAQTLGKPVCCFGTRGAAQMEWGMASAWLPCRAPGRLCCEHSIKMLVAREVTEVHLDMLTKESLRASLHQRRRHVTNDWCLKGRTSRTDSISRTWKDKGHFNNIFVKKNKKTKSQLFKFYPCDIVFQ